MLIGGKRVCPRPERSEGTPVVSTRRSRGVLGLLGAMALPSTHQPFPRDPGLPDLLLGMCLFLLLEL